MKKLFLTGVLVLTSTLALAQTQKGNFVIETATTFNSTIPGTGLNYYSEKDGAKTFNVGVDGGYFVAKNLAVKAGAGYGNTRLNRQTVGDAWSYKAGIEYYLAGKFPVQVSYVGSQVQDLVNDPSYISTQAGYSLFLNSKFNIKAFGKYDFALTDYYKNGLGFGVGFGYFFK